MEETDGGTYQHFNVISEEGAINSLQDLKILIFGLEVPGRGCTKAECIPGRVWCIQGTAVVLSGWAVGEMGGAEGSARKGRRVRV